MRLIRRVCLAASVALLTLACGGGDDDGVPLPELTPFAPEQQARLHEIRDAIAELRGLSVVEGLEEGSISRAQWQAFNGAGLDAASDDDREELQSYNDFWRLLRLIGPEEDLFELSNETYDSIVAGFYSLAEDALVLVDDGNSEVSLSEESTLAHEYVHSFQDARFDLERLRDVEDEEEDTVSELATTLSCVMEGDASWASFLYMMDEHGFAWILEAAEAEGTEEATAVIEQMPPAILEYATFNYDECLNFVVLVHNRLGWEGVDALYSNPPATTEQILHIQKYFDAEPAAAMPDSDLSKLLGKGWERLSVSAFGEFDVRTFLASAAPEGIDAKAAAEGWGGGRTALYRRGESAERDTLAHISLRWDTKADFEEFGAAFLGVLRAQGWQVTESPEHWHWQSGDDSGYALRNESSLHYDLIYSTDSEAAGIARAALRDGLAIKE